MFLLNVFISKDKINGRVDLRLYYLDNRKKLVDSLYKYVQICPSNF
jgi:hypothetical protein